MTDSLTPEPWMSDALCAQTDPEVFFPEKGESPEPAKSVCAECDVAAECLRYALDHRIQWGVWGGVSYRKRRDMWAAESRAA